MPLPNPSGDDRSGHRPRQRAARLHRRAAGENAALCIADAARPADRNLAALLAVRVERGAGCVYNDIVDRDLDSQVERTRLRPLASRRVSVRSAWMLVGALCLVGLVVLLQLNWVAAAIALGSLAPVAAYPFMK